MTSRRSLPPQHICLSLWPPRGAWVAVLTCVAVAACGDRGANEAAAQASSADRMPMLPGADAGHGAEAQAATPAPSVAQRFSVSRDAAALPASGALLPPVIHTAD